jgi:hypothetical protein
VRLLAENAELKASVRLLTAALRTTDQPADALGHAYVEALVLLRQARNGPIPHGTRYDIDKFLDRVSTRQPDQQAASMQDAPQPVEGTGKQSMQACTNEKQTLVQLTGRQADGLISATKALLDSVCPKCSGTGKEVVAEKTSWDGMTPYHYVTFCSACDGGRTADKSSDTPARGLHFDED